MLNMPIPLIAEVENETLKNIHTLKKIAEKEQYFVLIPRDILSAQVHIWQMITNTI